MCSSIGIDVISIGFQRPTFANADMSSISDVVARTIQGQEHEEQAIAC